MHINSISDFRAAVRMGPFAWPGGYPLFFICDDGAALCCKCTKLERRNVLESIAHKHRDGWRVVAQDVNWEDGELYCDHCSERIESAYAEPSEDPLDATLEAIKAALEETNPVNPEGWREADGVQLPPITWAEK